MYDTRSMRDGAVHNAVRLWLRSERHYSDRPPVW